MIFSLTFYGLLFWRDIFSLLGDEKPPEIMHGFSYKFCTLSHLDLCTNQCENKEGKISHLEQIANQLPDAFVDVAKVTETHIPAANTLNWVIVL